MQVRQLMLHALVGGSFMTAQQNGPIPLQVVFQGGGAKLCALMAVCSILEEYEKLGIIKINRVAGSSAGAIAAVMCSSATSIDEYKTRLKAVAGRYLDKMSTSKLFAYRRVALGGTYFKSFRLEDFFRELFCPKPNSPQTLDNLPIDTIFPVNELTMNLSPAAANDRYFKVLVVSQAVIAEVLRKLFAMLNRFGVGFEIDPDPIPRRDAIFHIEKEFLHYLTSDTNPMGQLSFRPDRSVAALRLRACETAAISDL